MARVVFGVPVHNGERHLAEAIETLLAQREHDLAVVLVDDGSTDATPELGRRYAELDPRFSYERHQRLGMIGAWRRAVAAARDHHPEVEYFAFGADHDAWHPRWLERMLAELDAHPEAVLAYPMSVRIGDRGEQLRAQAPWRFDTAGVADPCERFLRFSRLAVAGDMVYGLFRLSALERLSFPPVVGPDRLLLAQMALLGEFRQVPEVLWYRRYVLKVSAARQLATFYPDGIPARSRVPWPLTHFALLTGALAVRGRARPQVTRAAGAALAVRYLAASTWRQLRKQLLRPVGAASRALRAAIARAA